MMLKSRSRLLYGLLVLLAAAAPSAQSPSSPRPKPVSVQGIVINSLTGEPVAHAHVTLSGNTAPGTQYGAMTAVDGRFHINAIPSGSYQGRAEHRGYEGISLELKADSDLKNVAFRLVPTAVISGRVLNQEGEPAEHAWVSALGGASTASAWTNDKGEFRIQGLKSGRYLVKAAPSTPSLPPEIRTDGTTELNYTATFYPSSLGPKSASPVEVSAGGETAGVEIRLKSTPVVRVSGMVAGLPAGKEGPVEVELQRGQFRQGINVGPDLKFTIWRAPPGHYQVRASHHDRLTQKWIASEAVEVNLAGSNVDNIVLTLLPPFDVTGKVVYQDENGVDKRMRMLHLSMIGASGSPEHWVSPNSDGTFVVSGLPAGRYRVRLSGSEGDTYVKSVRLGDVESEDGILDLRSGPASVFVEIKLGENGARVEGKVSSAAGPAAGASVMLLSDTGNDGTYEVLAEVGTGRDGSYALSGLAPGKFRILACDPRDLNVSSDEVLTLYESEMRKIEVSEGDKVSQDLEIASWKGDSDKAPRPRRR